MGPAARTAGPLLRRAQLTESSHGSRERSDAEQGCLTLFLQWPASLLLHNRRLCRLALNRPARQGAIRNKGGPPWFWNQVGEKSSSRGMTLGTARPPRSVGRFPAN